MGAVAVGTQDMIDPNGYMRFLRSYYDDLYTKNPRNLRNKKSTDAISERLEQIIVDLKPKSALDIGCGQGDLIVFLGKNGITSHGIDLAANPLWDSIPSDVRDHVSFCAGNFLDASICGQYDVIVDSGCFHHQHPDVRIAYLTKIAELLRPETGVFLLSIFDEAADLKAVPVRNDTGTQFMTDGRLALMASASVITDILRAVGLVVRDVRPVAKDDGTPYSLVVEAISPGREARS
jgi:2-polyprenyl-3-methyl-5-hydroxy-6-metoxy-1,4-benzoquinol methylase